MGPPTRLLVAAAMVLALVSPALRDTDSFPLSTYPMYAGNREPVMSFISARGLTPSGAEVRLSIGEQARTDDPLIAESRFRRAHATGTLEPLCLDIADRVERERESGAVGTVEIIEQVYDVSESVPIVQATAVLVSCEVDR